MEDPVQTASDYLSYLHSGGSPASHEHHALMMAKLIDECLTLRGHIKNHCDRIAKQSELLTKVSTKGLSVRLRECYINRDNLKESCNTSIWDIPMYALVLESIIVAEAFRRKGLCKAMIGAVRDAVNDGHYDMAIVEGVQNPILADALTRWGWRCDDTRVMDFYWFDTR